MSCLQKSRMQKRSQTYLNLLAHFILLVISCVFFSESLVWTASRLQLGLLQPFNLVVLIGLGVLTYTKLNGNFNAFFQIQSKPILPTLVMITAALGYVTIHNLYGIQTFKTLFFLFFLYGYVGLFVPKKRWLAASLPVLLLFLVLPFGSLLDTYIGFPLRIQTAEFVNAAMHKMGLIATDSQTILGLENRYTQIDTTCSGINVLWAGTLLYITYSIIDSIQFNWKWFAFYLFYVILLLAFNAFRISVLVLLELVFHFSKIANGVHQPLGIVGFVIPSLLIWFLLTKYNKQANTKQRPKQAYSHNSKFSLVSSLGIAFVLAVLMGFTLRQSVINQTVIVEKRHFNLPFDSLELTTKEQAYFNFEKASAQKFKLNYKSLKGSLILVTSNSFKGHHNPELCLQSIGLQIADNKSVLINQKPIRLLKFKEDNISGAFWFKNSEVYTDDYSYRVWYDIKNGTKNNKWVQVTALFDNNYTASDLEAFFNYINQQI